MMALGRLRSLFVRSFDHARSSIAEAIRMDHTYKLEKPLFDFRSVEDLEGWTVGSDANIGGLSEAYWGVTPERTALFWGTLSTKVPLNSRIDRSGYAGVRSKQLPPLLFHQPKIDVSMFRYLAIRARGDRNQWFVNIRTEELYPSLVWQYRFVFKKPGEWETIMIPFCDFILTSHGYVQKQTIMDLKGIKTIGVSTLRHSNNFSLEIESIKAVNTPLTLGQFDVDPAMIKSM